MAAATFAVRGDGGLRFNASDPNSLAAVGPQDCGQGVSGCARVWVWVKPAVSFRADATH